MIGAPEVLERAPTGEGGAQRLYLADVGALGVRHMRFRLRRRSGPPIV
ncbi:protein of unknown function [Streptomyces sp. KY75]|nr:protein of unknown function [Streptomyces sp. KY70]CAD5986312.1 protein of unknown function [Streptomyces sp. KY75]